MSAPRGNPDVPAWKVWRSIGLGLAVLAVIILALAWRKGVLA